MLVGKSMQNAWVIAAYLYKVGIVIIIMDFTLQLYARFPVAVVLKSLTIRNLRSF